MHITYEKLADRHLKEMYEIRFSVTENRLHAHQIRYLQREQALDDIRQGGGWIANVDDEYVGYGLGIYAPDPLIGGLFIKPAFQRLGIGSQLLENITDWFSQQQARSMMLTTDTGSSAERFYEKHGWRAAGTDEYGQRIMRKP